MTKWVSGTATGFADLQAKFIDHITNDPDLVAAGENWTQAWSSGSRYVFQSPQGVHFGVDFFTDGLIHEWRFYGMTAVSSTAVDIGDHENASTTYKRILLDDFSLAYWMAMSGRRIVLVVKVSTYYEGAYLGWFLPYAAPSEWPQPLFIGGSAGKKTYSDDPATWTDLVEGHRVYVSSPHDSDWTTASGMYLDPLLNWVDLRLRSGSEQHIAIWPRRTPYSWDGSYQPNEPDIAGEHRMWPPTMLGYVRSAPNSERPLWPAHLFNEPGGYIAGALDGVYLVNGDGLTPESVITINGVNYFVAPDVFRQNPQDFYAIEMA